LNQKGEITSPFYQLFDAIERAFEIAAPFKSAQIEILLDKGDHYLVRNLKRFYKAKLADKESHNLDLTIRPVYCDETIPAR
jgi:hypothetical protein